MKDFKDNKLEDTFEGVDLSNVDLNDLSDEVEEIEDCPKFERVDVDDKSCLKDDDSKNDIVENKVTKPNLEGFKDFLNSKYVLNDSNNKEKDSKEDDIENKSLNTSKELSTKVSNDLKDDKVKKVLDKLKQLKGSTSKKIIIALLCGCLGGTLVLGRVFNSALIKATPIEASMTYNDFMSKVDKKEVKTVTLRTTSFLADVELNNGKKETIINPNTDTFIEDLGKKGVNVKIQMADFATELSHSLTTLLSLGFSGLLTGLMIFYFIKMLGMFKSKVSIDGKKNKRVEVSDTKRVTFEDVAGLTEEKEELQYAILCLKNAEQMKKIGVKPIKGILLEGEPGVGKTLLAKAVAGEANVPFYSYSGSDFTEMFVGMGAMRVRSMFDDAIANAPCVIFIDEIDALGGKRTSGSFGGNSERDNTLIAMLEKMDGMQGLDNVLVIGATNRVDALDNALVRPGRFDKVIHISRPNNKEDREAIVKVHLKNKKVADGITLEQISKEFYGFSGAEIESALNDAVLESFKEGKKGVLNIEHINKAVMKLIVKGVAKGRHNKKDKERVAIHEAGHAIMYKHLGKKLIKVSIQPYSGGVGGFTQADCEANEINFMTEKDFKDQVKVLYSGMVAEEVLLGSASTGASNDLERATVLLDKMLSTYGLTNNSLIVKSALNTSVVGSTVSDDYIKELDKLANSIKAEVVELFNTDSIKDELISLTEELLDKEVVYYN